MPHRTALVLGAGIMGLSAAWALARTGWRVTVVDQDPLPNPRGASTDHHRLIRHAYGDAVGYQAMVAPAFAAWDLLFATLGETLLVPTGVLALAAQPGGWLADSRTNLAAAGLHARTLAPAEIAARWPMLAPDGIADAFHLAPGGVLLATRIVASLARHLAASGVTFRRDRATAADPEAARLHLASGTTLAADLVVIAAGPWVRRLLGGVAVTPSRQVVVDLAPPAGLDDAWATAPMLLDLAPDGGFYAVPPVAGTPLKLGDHRFSMVGDAEDPRAASPAEAEAILALARHRLRDFDAYRVLGARACYYDVAEGEQFQVAPLGARGIVMTGFSGHGFKFGPLLGLALARAVGDPTLLAALPAWAAGQAAPPAGLLADFAPAA